MSPVGSENIDRVLGFVEIFRECKVYVVDMVRLYACSFAFFMGTPFGRIDMREQRDCQIGIVALTVIYFNIYIFFMPGIVSVSGIIYYVSGLGGNEYGMDPVNICLSSEVEFRIQQE